MNKKQPYVMPHIIIICMDKEALLQTVSMDIGSGGNASESENPTVDAKENQWGDTWDCSDESLLWDY